MPQGRYNLVVTRDQGIRNEETVYVELGSSETVNVTLPDVRQNTIFNVASGMTAITVKGMKDLLPATEASSIKVEMTSSSDTADILAEAAKDSLTTDNVKLYLDISIQERAENRSTYEEITALDNGKYLTFYIPLSGVYQNHAKYLVYRDDGTTIDLLTLTPNADGEYMSVDTTENLLTLYVNKSGVYALAFYETDSTPLNGVDDDDVTYTSSAIDISYLFDNIVSDGERTYTLTDGSGVGTLTEDGYLSVTTIGTFEITIKVQSTATTPAYIGTATVTVTAKEVTISGITCPDTDVSDITDVSAPVNQSGLLTGVEAGDDLHISFSLVDATIDDTSFASDIALTTQGINTFNVSVDGLELSGDDMNNYTLASDEAAAKITLTMALPYVAWPTATNIIYGQTTADSTLYGGKVIVLDNNVYTDITEFGSFKWVATETPNAAGSFEYAVQFVEDTDRVGYDPFASYRASLDAMTRMVNLTVDAAAVTFTIENNLRTTSDSPLSITATDELGNPLSASDYILYFRSVDSVWDLTAATPEPETIGEYYIAAAFVSENYRHAGTLESTAKQIGAYTIYEGETVPATYDVTFEGYSQFNITDALPQEIHILDTIDGGDYIGWLHVEEDTTYSFGDRFPQPDSDVTFTAIAAPVADKTISGTIFGTDLDGTPNTTLSGIGVVLMQGNNQVADPVTTGSDGTFSFTVAAGTYNLIITRDQGSQCEMTIFVDVTEDNYSNTFILPDMVQNAILEIASGIADITVAGLSNLAAIGSDNDTRDSEVKLTISASTTADEATIAEIVAEAAKIGLSADEVKYFMNIDLQARTGSDPYTTVTQADDLLTFYIPLTGIFQGHEEYLVYRYHNNDIQLLSETVNDDGEYIKVSDDKTNLIICAKFFSLYGIAFSNPSIVVPDTTTTTTTSSSSTITYTPVINAGDNGSISTISPARASKGTTVTFSVTADDGYSVDTVTVTDRSGNVVTVTDNGDGTYSFTQPASTVTISATFAEGEAETTETVNPFVDVSESDWFYDEVMYLYENGVMLGTTDTTFNPYGGNTRAMVAQIMYNIEGRPERTEFDFFPDVVVGQWHEEAINWCATYGVVDGYNDGLYRPDKVISKQEFASILYDHCLHLGYDMSNLDDLSSFNDVPSAWAETYVQWAVANGIIKGNTQGYLGASDLLTRCEMASMLTGFLQNVYQG